MISPPAIIESDRDQRNQPPGVDHEHLINTPISVTAATMICVRQLSAWPFDIVGEA
jgi:hypothetical protein